MVRKQMSLDVDLDIIKRLDEVYISTRYPGDLGLLPSGKPTIQDAKELFDFADAFYRNVKKSATTPVGRGMMKPPRRGQKTIWTRSTELII